MSITEINETPKIAARVVPVDLTLRTQQVEYLEYLSDRDESALSHALAKIIDRASAVMAGEIGKPARKVRKHFSLQIRHLSFIDRLTVKWGMSRAAVARRLIDEALAKDSGL